jgi:hypothetical protein
MGCEQLCGQVVCGQVESEEQCDQVGREQPDVGKRVLLWPGGIGTSV